MLLHSRTKMRLVFNQQYSHRPARRHEGKLQEEADANLNVMQIGFRSASEKPANDADQRFWSGAGNE
jgi:hypothetical protein